MALRIVKDSGWFYGVISEGGRRRVVNLRVKVEGRRPASLRDLGDAAFEASRARALVALEDLKASWESVRGRRRLVERLRAESGGGSILLAECPAYARKKLVGRDRSARYVVEVCGVLGALAAFFPGRRADELSGLDVERWWRSLGGGARTRNKKLGVVAWLYGELVRDGLADVSPVAGVEKARGQAVRRAPFSRSEIGRILDAAEKLRPLCLVGLHTGMRLMDCARLLWADVDLAGGWIKVRTAKTGASAEIPLAEPLARLLGGLEVHDGFCFPEWAAWPVWKLSKAFGEVRARAGLGRWQDFHAFRVTFVTEALAGGLPVELLRRITGHATVEVVLRHYFQPGREQFREAVRRALPEHLGGRSAARAELMRLAELLSEPDVVRLVEVARGLGAADAGA